MKYATWAMYATWVVYATWAVYATWVVYATWMVYTSLRLVELNGVGCPPKLLSEMRMKSQPYAL